VLIALKYKYGFLPELYGTIHKDRLNYSVPVCMGSYSKIELLSPCVPYIISCWGEKFLDAGFKFILERLALIYKGPLSLSI